MVVAEGLGLSGDWAAVTCLQMMQAASVESALHMRALAEAEEAFPPSRLSGRSVLHAAEVLAPPSDAWTSADSKSAPVVGTADCSGRRDWLRTLL